MNDDQIKLWWSHQTATRKCQIATQWYNDEVLSPKEASRIFLEVLSPEDRLHTYRHIDSFKFIN